MAILIDTDVAIHLRDGDAGVRQRVDAFPAQPCISAITRVELENGVYRQPLETNIRRVRLDFLLTRLTIIDFDGAAATVFSGIVATIGVSKPRTIDRMIAATALLHGITLITMNGHDFRDIPNLKLEIWDSPAV